MGWTGGAEVSLQETVVCKTFEPSYVTDFAAAIDQPREVLAEVLGISPEQAGRVIAWAQGALDSARNESKAQTMAMVLAELVPAKPGNLSAIIGGLLLASGAASVNGMRSQADVARNMEETKRCPHCTKKITMTVTRALICHYTNRWADKLGLKSLRFRRGDENRDACRESRNRVVKGGRVPVARKSDVAGPAAE